MCCAINVFGMDVDWLTGFEVQIGLLFTGNDVSIQEALYVSMVCLVYVSYGLLSLCLYELISLITLMITLKKRYGMPVFRLFGFILRDWKVITAPIFCMFISTVFSRLEHSGYDNTFTFTWPVQW